MSDQDVQKQIEELRQQINYHNYRYHTLDAPIISDYEFDQLMNKLKELEAAHPELITPDSPTQRSGGQPLEKFRKVQHPMPVLSLANGFGRQDVLDWYDRILKINPVIAQADYVLEPKLDGLTVVLHYENGLFNLGATRGRRPSWRRCHGKSEDHSFSAVEDSHQRRSQTAGTLSRARRSDYL